jgi:hypothetical protein
MLVYKAGSACLTLFAITCNSILIGGEEYNKKPVLLNCKKMQEFSYGHLSPRIVMSYHTLDTRLYRRKYL